MKTKVHPTIFAAVTAARGSRPAAVEVGKRESMTTGEPTFDSREWDWDDSGAGVDIFSQTDVPEDLPEGAEIDCYVWKRYGAPGRTQETFLEQNITLVRVAGGWVAEEDR